MAQRQWRSDDTDNWKYGFGDGHDGSTYSAPSYAGAAGTAGTKTLTISAASSFANDDLILIHQSRGTSNDGSGVWELNKIISGGGSTTLTLESDLTHTYTNSGNDQAQVMEMKEYDGLTTGSITPTAWNQDIYGMTGWFDKGTTTVDGTITLSSKGFVYGNQVQGNPATAYCGEGIHGASTQTNNPTSNAGGGGYQSSGAAGGGGGANGVAGGNGIAKNGTGGDGGETYGSASLVTCVFGGGGGGGTRDNNSSGRGGYGAGAIFIFAKDISITGAIALTGENGQTNTNGGGGGGGGGGSCLIKCQTGTLGTNKITAAGGSGGTGVNLDGTTKNGGDGGAGRIHIDYSVSYTGTTSPTIDATNDITIVPASSATGNFFMVF